MKVEQTECSETLAYKIQMPGNYPEESIQQNYIILFIKRICATHKWQSQVGPEHVMKAYSKAEKQLQALIMSQLDGGKQ